MGAILLASVALGCHAGRTATQDPRELLREYAKALRNSDAEAAWALLDADAKRQQSFEAFAQWLRTHPAEAARLADQLERPGGPVSVVTEIPMDDGPPVQLVTEGGRTRILASSLDPFSQATPELTLTTFQRAFRAGRYDVLWRLMPEAKRRARSAKELEASLRGDEKPAVAALARSLDYSLPAGKWSYQATEARLDLGAGAFVRLLLEEGRWVIEDFVP